ncbi:MAG: nucleotidyl transferase AbiEii/AbiGii toxin family protein [Candidatus Delongbacteria bacterium]|nr:nucleotidyl transferase AbiEii/AbiGii toxin family protein [Candidatus Delongbacteria bacterium]MCG2759786.1 nucleotidyl transferase AbiEii/AbiGii toxin family protein [Candidatus Delongbacteria bacterium]
MEKKIDYNILYEVQDEVLKIVFSLENSFYLTGGTALHRFHYSYRYSDDLDFFAPNDDLYSEYIKQISDKFSSENIEYTHTVHSRDFNRLMVDNVLQLDFVNDRVYREGLSIIKDNRRIDNITNILTNKISAILSRDEEKDFFDLFCIAFNEPFDWNQALSIAGKKCICQPDMLIYRLKSFPLDWLNRIKRTDKTLEIKVENVNTMCGDILEKRKNSLVGR